MEAVRQIERKYGRRALITAIFIGFILILAGYKPAGKGLILGALFGIINFVLMGEAIPLQIMRTGSKASLFFRSLGSMVFRYALLAVPVFLAIRYDTFELFAVLPGIMMVQIMILTEQVYKLIHLRHKKQLS